MALQISVYGRVQGVYYRASCKNKAIALGLQGFAKNLKDGSVLVHAEGKEDALLELLEWCGKGPDFAKVKEIKSEEVPDQDLSGFRIQ